MTKKTRSGDGATNRSGLPSLRATTGYRVRCPFCLGRGYMDNDSECLYCDCGGIDTNSSGSIRLNNLPAQLEAKFR